MYTWSYLSCYGLWTICNTDGEIVIRSFASIQLPSYHNTPSVLLNVKVLIFITT